MSKSVFMPAIREGILQLEPPCLVGSYCAACRTRVFPARSFCPACSTQEEPSSVALSTEGTVFSFTTVLQAPGNRPVPYTLAYIDLVDGVRVMAQIDELPDEVCIGMRVELVLRNVVPEPGEPRLGYAFVATQA